MNFLRRFMLGRYGNDSLNLALITVSVMATLLLRLVAAFTGLFFLIYIGWLPLGWAIFRMLSRNIQKRRIENERFLKYWTPLQSKLRFTAEKFRLRKTYKYFTCPNCGAHLRIPRQGGKKVSVTCKKCGLRFTGKA